MIKQIVGIIAILILLVEFIDTIFQKIFECRLNKLKWP